MKALLSIVERFFVRGLTEIRLAQGEVVGIISIKPSIAASFDVDEVLDNELAHLRETMLAEIRKGRWRC